MPDGTFALHVMDSSVYSAEHMPGPWKRIGSMKLDSRGIRPSDRLGSNLTTEFRPDGSIILMKKDGDVGDLEEGHPRALQDGFRSRTTAAQPAIPRTR